MAPIMRKPMSPKPMIAPKPMAPKPAGVKPKPIVGGPKKVAPRPMAPKPVAPVKPAEVEEIKVNMEPVELPVFEEVEIEEVNLQSEVKESVNVETVEEEVTDEPTTPLEIEIADKMKALQAKLQDKAANNGEDEKIAEEPEVQPDTEPVEEIVQEEIQEEIKEEPKKTTKAKKTTKSTKKKEEPQLVEENDDNIFVFTSIEDVIINNVPLEEYDDYMNGIITPVTELWQEEKDTITAQMKSIAIDSEMDPGTCKEMLQHLDNISTDAYSRYMKYKAKYDNVAGKDGKIDTVKLLNSKGSNPEQRKQNSMLACMNFKKPGAKKGINLFDYMYMARDQYCFYEGIMKQIELKKQLLITFNGMLKIENSY